MEGKDMWMEGFTALGQEIKSSVYKSTVLFTGADNTLMPGPYTHTHTQMSPKRPATRWTTNKTN